MQLKSFRDYVELKQGLAINKGTDYLISNVKDSEFNIPLLRIADMVSGTFSRYVSKKVNPNVIASNSDIIYTRTGQIGLAFKDYTGVVHNNSFIVSIKKEKEMELNKDYLFTVLNSDFVRKQAMSLAHSSVQPDLTHEMFKNMCFPLPNIKEQEWIAEIYANLTKKIDNNMDVIQTLEYMAKTIYDYWFVQFDFPDADGRPYKSSGGKMVWNETLSREIPAGWEVIQLNDFAEVTQGNSPAGNTLNEEKKGIAFYQGKTDFGMRFPIERIYTTEPYRYAEPMDTLLSVRAPVGSVNMSEDKCCIGRGLAAIHQEMYPSLVYYMMMRLQPIFEKRGSGGTTFDSITKDDIKEVYICRPPKMYCECFEDKARAIDNQILNLSKENRKLASLRDYLLPMLMNGQVTFHQ